MITLINFVILTENPCICIVVNRRVLAQKQKKTICMHLDLSPGHSYSHNRIGLPHPHFTKVQLCRSTLSAKASC